MLRHEFEKYILDIFFLVLLRHRNVTPAGLKITDNPFTTSSAYLMIDTEAMIDDPGNVIVSNIEYKYIKLHHSCTHNVFNK